MIANNIRGHFSALSEALICAKAGQKQIVVWVLHHDKDALGRSRWMLAHDDGTGRPPIHGAAFVALVTPTGEIVPKLRCDNCGSLWIENGECQICGVQKGVPS